VPSDGRIRCPGWPGASPIPGASRRPSESPPAGGNPRRVPHRRPDDAGLKSAGARRVAMAKTTPFTIGADASCTDGACGKMTRVVVDPIARAITHLVVEPRHGHGIGRLVPLGLVDATTGEIRLRCTLAEFGQLDPAEERQFLPGSPGYPGYDPDQVLSWAYYDLGGGPGVAGSMASVSQTATYDSVPLGEVEVRRGEHVHATDGAIGLVQGLVIDRASHHVTHVLLPGGAFVGPQGSGYPDQRRDRGRRRHPPQHHQAAGTGPAARGHRSPERIDPPACGKPRRHRAAHRCRPGSPASWCTPGNKAWPRPATRDHAKIRRAARVQLTPVSGSQSRLAADSWMPSSGRLALG
jgi:hypothetical protein